MPDPIEVRFRDCTCPGTPHPDEGDIAYLRPFLDYAGGVEALRAYTRLLVEIQTERPELTDEAHKDELELVLTDRSAPIIGPILIRRGVIGWNVLDGDGDPVPCTQEALVALRWEDAYALGDRADDLYGEQVFAPFQKPTASSSKNGQTVGSIHTPMKRSAKRRSRSTR